MLMFGTKMKQGDEFLSDTLTDHQKRQRDAQRGENLYLNAQMTEKENYEQLQSSRFVNIFGREKDDTESMVAVKQASTSLHDHLYQPVNISDPEGQLAVIERDYATLINKCESYLSSHRFCFSGSGRARKNLVRNTMINAKREFDMFRPKAMEMIFHGMEAGELWVNVLGEIRSGERTLGPDDYMITGGGTSKVIVYTQFSTPQYFKETSRMGSIQEEGEKLIADQYYPAVKEKMRDVLDILVSGGEGSILSTALKSDEFINSLRVAEYQEVLQKHSELINMVLESNWNTLDLSQKQELTGRIRSILMNEQHDAFVVETINYNDEKLMSFLLDAVAEAKAVEKRGILNVQAVKQARSAYRGAREGSPDQAQKLLALRAAAKAADPSYPGYDTLSDEAFIALISASLGSTPMEVINDRLQGAEGTPEGDLFSQKVSMADKATRQALLSLCPEYAKWVTRNGIAGLAGIPVGETLEKRNVATSRVADYMGLSSMIANSRMTKINVNGVTKKGVSMDGADGIPMGEFVGGKKKGVFTPEALKQLSRLQLFDIICGQVDRNYSNIFCIGEPLDIQGADREVYRITAIQGIDNDLSFGTVDWQNVISHADGLAKMVSPVDASGNMQIPFIDSEMAATIAAIDMNELHRRLSDLISDAEFAALRSRIQGLQTLIAQHPERIVDSEGWSAEVAGEYTTKAQPQNAYFNNTLSSMHEHEYYQSAKATEQEKKWYEKHVYRQEAFGELFSGKSDHDFLRILSKIVFYNSHTHVSPELEDIGREALSFLIRRLSQDMIREICLYRTELEIKIVNLIEDYRKRPVPKVMLKEGVDGDSEHAHLEYAYVLLKGNDLMLEYDGIQKMLADLRLVQINLNGIRTSAAELYMTEKKKTPGVDPVKWDGPLSEMVKTANRYDCLKEETVRLADGIRARREDREAAELSSEFSPPIDFEEAMREMGLTDD